jgi:hypothetical protein
MEIHVEIVKTLIHPLGHPTMKRTRPDHVLTSGDREEPAEPDDLVVGLGGPAAVCKGLA